jgi:hypothetical protein
VRRASVRPRMRLASATKRQFVGASRGAALPRTKIATAPSRALSVPRPPGTAGALGEWGRWQASRLCVGQGALRRPSCAAPRTPPRSGTTVVLPATRVTRRRLPATRAARLTSEAGTQSCQSVRRRDRTPGRSPDAVAQQHKPTDTIGHGLALRRDRKKRCQLPRVSIRLD